MKSKNITIPIFPEFIKTMQKDIIKKLSTLNTSSLSKTIDESDTRGVSFTRTVIVGGCTPLVGKVNRFTYISEMTRKTIYKDCVSIFLRYHSKHRHMWE